MGSKDKKPKNANTSSFVFKLVTQCTAFMLLLIVLFTGIRQLFGESITCKKSLDSYLTTEQSDIMGYSCWIKGRFSKSLSWNQYKHYSSSNPNYQGEEYLKIGFYNWIIPLLLFQALCLAAPIVHWHYKQEQTIPKCLKKLPTEELTDEWIVQRKQLINYFKNIQKSYHQVFAFKYLFCEVITIMLITLVMLLMNFSIADFWNEYQSAAMSFLTFDFARFYRESSHLFPKQASCDFYTYELNVYTKYSNTVCYFPQNEFYAKVFVFLYIWYIFIMTWAILHFIVLAALFSTKSLRLKQIRRMLGRPATTCECNYLSDNGDIGLWFALKIFRRNMHLVHFQDLCTALLSEVTRPANA